MMECVEEEATVTRERYNVHIFGHRWGRWLDYLFRGDETVLPETAADEEAREKRRSEEFSRNIAKQ